MPTCPLKDATAHPCGAEVLIGAPHVVRVDSRPGRAPGPGQQRAWRLLNRPTSGIDQERLAAGKQSHKIP